MSDAHPPVLRESPVAANTVRVPDPEPGTATVVKRYNERRAVVLHPEDYDRLIEDGQVVATLGRLDPLPPMAPYERQAHVMETTPGAETPILEDYDRLSAWLALGREQ